MLRLILAAIAALAFVAAPRAQVRAPTMLATDSYLFVIRGDQIFQFHIDTLQLLNQAELPPDPEAGAETDDMFRALRDWQARLDAQMELEEAEIEEVELAEPDVVEVVEEGFDSNAWNSAIGLGGGAGGKFGGRPAGQERLERRSGRQTAEAISNAQRWLAAHQDEDGKWDADGFMKHDVAGAPCDGPGNPVHDVGVTGLALLTFLADGNTLRSGPYKDSLKRGIVWLRAQQDPESGRFGPDTHHDFIYGHAIATLAMTEAYGLSDYKLLKKHAQLGIDYLGRHRNPYRVWRYMPRDGDNDTSVTAWCVMACKTALDFKLDVDQQTLEMAASWFDQMTDPGTGRTGYIQRGGRSARRAGDHAVRFPHDSAEAMTSATLFCRFMVGQSPRSNPIMNQQADLIVEKLPRWEAGVVDEYAWMFGSLAMFQTGGRHWRAWSTALRDALIPSQRSDDNSAGSWDPIGVWGEDGGRVFATAMHCLSLQSYYRYTKMVR